jgi:hypothetical protein
MQVNVLISDQASRFFARRMKNMVTSNGSAVAAALKAGERAIHCK